MHPNTTNITSQVEKLGRSLALLVDVLIPGGDGWPAASAVGVQHAMLMRLLDTRGDLALASLSDLLEKYGFNGPRGSEAQIESASRMEANDPEAFLWIRSSANYAYYESPVVVSLIDSKGTPYRLMPHLEGYDLAPFDEASQTPTHGRGQWIATDAVKPIDISGLDLQTRTTERWGLSR